MRSYGPLTETDMALIPVSCVPCDVYARFLQNAGEVEADCTMDSLRNRSGSNLRTSPEDRLINTFYREHCLEHPLVFSCDHVRMGDSPMSQADITHIWSLRIIYSHA